MWSKCWALCDFPLWAALGLVFLCGNPILTSSLSLPPQGLPGVPGKRGKMGRPVKIFRVYYADSMGEPELPLAMLPCPPVAWAFSACIFLFGHHSAVSVSVGM